MNVPINKNMPEQMGNYLEKESTDGEKFPKEEGENEGQNANQHAKEQLTRTETVPECPSFQRQMLFMKPFNIYRDPIDANDGREPRQERSVPAAYYVIDDSSKLGVLCIGDKEGNQIGWIRKEAKNGYDWSIRGYWKPDELSQHIADRRAKVYREPTHTSASLDFPFDLETTLPIIDVKAEDDDHNCNWYKVIGPSVDRIRNGERPWEAWVPMRNANDQIISKVGFLVTEKQMKQFVTKIRLIHEAYKLQSITERKSSDVLLDALHDVCLRLLGAEGKNMDVKQSRAFVSKIEAPDSLQMTLDDISRMDEEGFKRWLNRLIVCEGRCQELLGGANPREKMTYNIAGKDEVLIRLPVDALP